MWSRIVIGQQIILIIFVATVFQRHWSWQRQCTHLLPVSHACWLNHLGLWDPSGKNIVTDKGQSEKLCFDWAFRVLRNFRISMLDIGHYIAQTESNSIHIIHLIRRIMIIDIFGNWISLNYITRISYGNCMQVMELSHHILMDTLTALAPTTLLSRWSTWKSAFEPFYI